MKLTTEEIAPRRGGLRMDGMKRRPVTPEDLAELKDQMRFYNRPNPPLGNMEHYTLSSMRVSDLIEDLEDSRAEVVRLREGLEHALENQNGDGGDLVAREVWYPEFEAVLLGGS